MIDAISDDIYDEIASDPNIRDQLLMDISLDLEVFAEKHGPTIMDHYVSQYPIEPEYANDIAAVLWWHLHPDYQRPLPKAAGADTSSTASTQGARRPNSGEFWPL
jgi:hypothetical protein